jgi:hypothetical protein
MLGMMLAYPTFKRTIEMLKSYVYRLQYPRGLLRQALRVMPHVDFFQVYGQERSGAHCTMCRQRSCSGRPNCAYAQPGFLPLDGEIKIIDESGKIITALRGTVGIAARSPDMYGDYWQQSEQT